MQAPSPDAVEALFQQAADLAPEQCVAFLDQQCAGDGILRAAVEVLLEFDAMARDRPDFLQRPAAKTRDAVSIGRYRVVRCLGAGGMGTVYEAVQDGSERTVALKVMRPGLDSADHRKRFLQEASILGRLKHVGIAQVYDAGETADGQLYIAMEYIRGLVLDEYVRRHATDVRMRLDLAAKLCDAVQHAHEHDVVHRDLKPANIMVDEAGQPKVLDFGIARAAAGVLESTAHTRTGQLIGTLGYMSPEQVAADPHAIDARSDVYALGVILFELLADRHPYQFDRLPIHEIVRVIREVEPARLGTLNRTFRGEIETIVAKAMEKEKGRRYASAGELAADLRRFLAHEPIRARPASTFYKSRKFVSRHKGLVAGTAVAFAALLAGMVVALIQAADARASARQARSQAYQARVATAVFALAGHDVVEAGRQLKQAPEDLRGWEWTYLRTRLDDRLRVIVPAPGEKINVLAGRDGIRVVRFAGKQFAVTDLDGRHVAAITLPDEYLGDGYAQWTTAGLRIVGWVGDELRLWDEAGQVRHRLSGAVGATVLSPDGSRVAVFVPKVGLGYGVVVFDCETGRRVAECYGHPDLLYAARFSPDGTRIATAGEDAVVILWDAATGARVAECRGHTAKVVSICYRPDGARLTTTSDDGSVRQWDAATGAAVEPPFDRHTGSVYSAAYSPDGEWVASGGADRTIRLWRATGRQEVAVLQGHTGLVSSVAFAPDGRRLASLSQRWALDGAGDETAGVWEVDVRASLPALRGHARDVYPVAYSPDGQWIASGSWDHTVRVWDAATGEPVATLPQSGIVRSLAFSHDGGWLVCGGNLGNKLVVWDVATASVRQTIPGPGNSVWTLAVSPDSTRIAAGNNDDRAGGCTMGVWDVATGQKVASGPGNPYAFSPDGRLLVGKDAEKDIVLWNTRDYNRVATWKGHTAVINSVSFRGDGNRIVSASDDRTARVWNVATGQCQRVFDGHTDDVFAAVFHPDGTRVASAGRDRAVVLWDPDGDQEGVRLPGHKSFIWSLAFSPDGATLASGSGDKTVRFWDTFPLKERYAARREAEALRPEAERLVESLWSQKGDAAAVVATLRSDRALAESLRHAALRVVMQRVRPADAASGQSSRSP